MISKCHYDKTFIRWLSIDSPATIAKYVHEGQISIEINGDQTHWSVLELAGETLLKPIGKPVDRISNKKLSLIKTDGLGIALREAL